MASISLRCPHCEAIVKLATRPAEGKKVKCPECAISFVAADNEVTKGSTAVKSRPDRPAVGAAKNRAARDDDDEEDEESPRRGKGKRNPDDDGRRLGKKKPASKAGLIIGLCVGAAALLLCVPVGLGVAWVLLAAKANPQLPVAPNMVAKVAEPPANKVAEVPVVNEPPAKQKGKPIPPVRPPVKPPEPKPVPVAVPVDLDKDLLTKTTRATALIRVNLGNQAASGSGFLVKASGDTAYIITNFHVIAMEKIDSPPPVSKGGKGPKSGPPPIMKGPKGGPFGGSPFGQPSQQPKATRPKVTVVLHSGTPEEQALAAEVVAFDEEADLAALRVTGARNLPEAIDVAKEAAVAETLPVYIFGFPVIKGKAGAPTVTVGKGTISGLRRDPNSNELTDVHINGEINPGNSGGPVIDAQGRLVGIAVATVPGKQIGFAVPAAELNQMFKGRLSNAIVFQLKMQGTRLDAFGEVWVHDRKSSVRAREALSVRLPDVPNGTPAPTDEFLILARLTDPMLKVGAVSAYFAMMKDAPVKADGQDWAKIPGATPVSLKIQDQSAIGTFKLPNGAIADETYAFQFSYVNADGKTIFTQPHLVRLTFPKNPKSVTLNIFGIPNVPTRRYIEDSAPGLFAGKVAVKERAIGKLVLEIDPIPDPQVIAAQINFGNVTNLQGRTFTVQAKKLDLPLPNAADIDAALADLKSTDGRRRIAAADQLAKAYAPLPERRAEVAKALEGLVTDKDGWLGKTVMRALLVWAGPENIAGIAPAVDNAFIAPEAFDVLVQFKNPEAAELVAKYLRSIITRDSASNALKTMGPVAEKAVIPYVTNQDGWVCRLACGTLAEIGTAQSVPVLTTVANSNNAFVSPAARDALKSVQARLKGGG